MFIYTNPNPINNLVGDCVIRAISIATGLTWEEVYDDICDLGRDMYDMPSSNAVWGEYLSRIGFMRSQLPNTCPMCYTVRQFAYDHPHGSFILGTGSHVIAIIDGDYYDTWDSGDEVPVYFFKR